MIDYSVLAIDENPQVLGQLTRALVHNINMLTARSVSEALVILRKRPTDFIILGSMEMGAVEAINRLKAVAPDAEILLKTDDIDEAVLLFDLQKISRVLQATSAPHEVEKHIKSLVHNRPQGGSATPEMDHEVLVQATLRTLLHVSQCNHADLLLAGVEEACEILVGELGGEMKWEHSLAAQMLPAGFGLLTYQEIETVKAGNLYSDAFQLSLRRAFLSLAQLLGNEPRLKYVGHLLAKAPFSIGRLRHPHRWDPRDFPHILHVAALWCVLGNQGLSRSHVVAAINTWFPSLSPSLRQAVWTLPDCQAVAATLGLKELEIGMVLLQPLDLPEIDLVVDAGQRLTRKHVKRLQHASNLPARATVLVAETTIQRGAANGLVDKHFQEQQTSDWGKVQFDLTRTEFLDSLRLF